VDVLLRYFDDCPNWRIADERLHAALAALGLGGSVVRYEEVLNQEQADAIGFVGSPTILADGEDLFATPGTEPGLACRLYETPDGLRGAPTVEELIAALVTVKVCDR